MLRAALPTSGNVGETSLTLHYQCEIATESWPRFSPSYLVALHASIPADQTEIYGKCSLDRRANAGIAGEVISPGVA
jgi:hypothetical protein